MICPKCHREYSSLNPCDCSKPDFPPLPKREMSPDEINPAEVTSKALKPTGISDPFWH